MTEEERYLKEIEEQEMLEAQRQEYIRCVEESLDVEYFRQLELAEQFE